VRDRLAQLLTLQHDLQVETYGYNFQRMSAEDRVRYIKDMQLALQSELQEALNEVGWKPWVTNRQINREAYLGELVDALHFLLNLTLIFGDDPVELADELFERYTLKRSVNARRQAEGYDGVSTKCPRCRRALDDPAVACTVYSDTVNLNGDAAARGGFCAVAGVWVAPAPRDTVAP
jgi:hypothetical protein